MANNKIAKNLTSQEIQEWFIAYLAKVLTVDGDQINIEESFERYGIDSAASIGMTGDLADWLGIELDPTLIYDYPTIKAMMEYLTANYF